MRREGGRIGRPLASVAVALCLPVVGCATALEFVPATLTARFPRDQSETNDDARDVDAALADGTWVREDETDSWAWRPAPEDARFDADAIGSAELRRPAAAKDEATAVTATLLLARRGEPLARDEVERLEAAVVIPETVRPHGRHVLAAARAWPRLLVETGDGAVADALAPAGRVFADDRVPAEVRTELLLALAEFLAPGRIRAVDDLWAVDRRAVDPSLRRAGAEACLRYADEHPTDDFAPDLWPLTWEQARYDADPVVRATFGRWAVAARHPDAARIADRMLDDADGSVRVAGCEALAGLAVPAATERLREAVRTDTDDVVAAALTALAAVDAGVLTEFAGHDRVATRSGVAKALASVTPGEKAARAAVRLVADRQPDVQETAVASLADWPDDDAVPVLAEAVVAGNLRTRRAALSALRRRTGDATPFPLDGDRHERLAAVEARAWARPARPRSGDLAAVDDETRTGWDADADVVLDSDADRDARRAALGRLAAAGRPAIDHLDARATTDDEPDRFVTDLLATLDPSYETLASLRSADVAVRRRAAAALPETLTPAILAATLRRLPTEQDAAVWRSVLDAVVARRDRVDDAAVRELVAAGVGHQWADIRVATADFAGRLAEPPLGPSLRPLFDDAEPAVRLAAVEAVGRCGHPLTLDGRDGGRGLADLFDDPEPGVAIAALTAASAMDDPAAWDRLTAAAWGRGNATVTRNEAIAALGRTGRADGFPLLVNVAWATHDDAVRAAATAALEELSRTSGLGPPSVTTGRPGLADWAAWCERNGPVDKLDVSQDVHPTRRAVSR